MDLTGKYILGAYRPRNKSSVEGLAIFNDDQTLDPIKVNQRNETFAPRGFAFIPKLSKTVSELIDGDFIKCQILKSQTERDHQVVNVDTIKSIKKTLVIDYNGFILGDLEHIDLSIIREIVSKNELADDTNFYILDRNGLYGLFLYKDDNVSPKFSDFVKFWSKNKIENLFIEYQNKKYLLSDYAPESSECIDAMTSKQLAAWFRKHIQILNAGYVKQLDEKTDWRKKLLELIESLSQEKKELEEVRFARMSETIQSFELKVEDIKNLAEHSEVFQNLYQTKIDQHKDEVLSPHITDIQAQIDKKKGVLEEIEHHIQTATVAYQKIEATIQKLKPQEQLLKDSLLPKITEQFQAFKEILGNSTDTISPSVCFEYKEAIGEPLSDYSKIKEYVTKIFGQYGIKQDLADALLREMFLKQAIFIPHGKVAKAVAQGFGNSQRYITSVSHRWESFSCLLKNGLSQAWKAALENPNKYIILLLQDINMAPPECWGRPLLNVISGIQDNLDFLGEWPQNLWIFATILPTQDPAIGLPLNQDSFLGWGAISNEDWKDTKEQSNKEQSNFEPKHVAWDHWASLQKQHAQEQDKLSTDDNTNLEAYFQI